MENTTTEERCRKVLANETGIEPEDFETASKLIEDLGMDSLDCVEIVVALEAEFGIEIDSEDQERVTAGTFGELVQYIEKRFAA